MAFCFVLQLVGLYNPRRRQFSIMHVNANGKIHGDRIDLDRILSEFPDGAAVNVSVTACSLSLDEKHTLIDSLCGSWQEDATIVPIFDEIARERSASTERTVTFDDPS